LGANQVGDVLSLFLDSKEQLVIPIQLGTGPALRPSLHIAARCAICRTFLAQLAHGTLPRGQL
jgi:hypothetical protein